LEDASGTAEDMGLPEDTEGTEDGYTVAMGFVMVKVTVLAL
jgi:hypothetical protein